MHFRLSIFVVCCALFGCRGGFGLPGENGSANTNEDSPPNGTGSSGRGNSNASNTNTNTNTNDNDNVAPEVGCGNGVLDAGEDCDPDVPAGTVCADVVPGSSGTLGCDSSCLFSTDACDLPVVPLLPVNGSAWADWVQATANTSALELDDVACDPTASTARGSCRHAGELRAITLPSAVTSCAGVSASDALGAFRWSCGQRAGATLVYTTGFLPDRGLKDIVLESGFVSNPVTVVTPSGEFSADLGTAWPNPVTVFPISTGDTEIRLSTPGSIYVTRATAGVTFSLEADRVSFVQLAESPFVLPADATPVCDQNTGETTTGPGAVRCLITAGDHDFLWVEGHFEGETDIDVWLGVNLVDVSHSVVRATNLRRSHVRNLAIRGASFNDRVEHVTVDASWNGWGLGIEGQGHFLHDIVVTRAGGNLGTGAMVVDASNSVITDFASYNAIVGLRLGGDNNTLVRVSANSSSSNGFENGYGALQPSGTKPKANKLRFPSLAVL
ncbi:MAG: hypothetical protein AAF654_03565 [Myxococcota bacterium]